MFRKIMILLLVCAVLDVQAMKRTNDELAIQEKEEAVCYLANIPADIQNHIATLVLNHYKAGRETEENFIERARKKEEVYARIRNNYRVTDAIDKECCVFGSCNIYSPGENNVSSLGSFDGVTEYSIRTKECTYIADFYVQKKPTCIAVSEKGQLAGFINKNDNNSKYVLKLINLIDRQTIKFDTHYKIPLFVENINTLLFNRQGTKVIVFGKKLDLEGNLKKEDYEIIYFKIKDDNEAVKKADKKGRQLLQHYFGKKMVCKALAYNV